MLHLLTGPDRVELSNRILELISSGEEKRENSRIFIVPEQFSHEMERRLCKAGGDTVSRYAEVLSLSRLADRVAEAHGGTARAYLDQGGRVLAMALAAEQVVSRIKLFAAVIRKPEFLADMVSIVDEFQSYCLEPRQLLEASKQAEGQFAQKLEELGLLYEAYLAVCANSKADPAGRFLWLRDVLVETDWAEKRSFYIDGFGDFTGAETAVLEVLLRQSPHVWLAVTEGEGQQVCRPTQQTIKKLRHMAERWDIPVELIPIGTCAHREPAITKLLAGWFSAGKAETMASACVKLTACSSVEEECRQAASEVKRLLASGARCREIAVACTDTGLYEAPLRAALRTAGLPFYFAGRDDILSKPILHGVLSALQAAVGPMDYEDVALFLKSGLPFLSREDCDRLDSYAYSWNLRGNQWERPWDLHPRGFGESWTDEDRSELALLNEKKEQALTPLLRLRKRLFDANNTGKMVESFHAFLEELELSRRLEEKANELGGQMGQELSQLYDILLQSMEQTWLMVGDTIRTPDEFARLYRSVLTQYHVGTIPSGIDQVYVGALQDLRQKVCDHVLVLGASDGSFPSYQTGEGLLTEEERKHLMAQGIALAPLRADIMDHEMQRICSALSAPMKTIRLSYAGDQPAWLYRRCEAMFPDSVVKEEPEVFLDVPELAAWRLRHEDDSSMPLPQLEKWEKALRTLREYDFTDLSKETVQGLYGRNIYLSASRIDKYAACRFAFFLAYGLKAQPRKQAKMDPSVFGTFVHAVLQNTVLRVKQEGGFREIPQDRLIEVALEEIDAYAREYFPQQAQRSAYLFDRSRREIMEIVQDLGEELRHSLFQPADCELEFSMGGDLPAVEIQGQEAMCRISGFVDRVDLYEKNGKTYVRVVDYKTGRKDFDYTDILNGAGLQMLIYLFALKELGGKHYGRDQLIPAGVLYVPARSEYSLTLPMPSEDTVLERHREERRRRGLVSREDELLSAMEQDAENPRYMPYKNGKNGPEGDLADERQMELLEHHVLRTLANMTDAIASGEVSPNPIVRGQDSSCRFCDYQDVCHMDICRHETRIMASTASAKFWEKLEQEESSHG